jgi:amidohydrolase
VRNEIKDNNEFVDWLISLRRHFHQFPEISFSEFNTQAKIIEILNSLGIENSKIAGTGVIGIIKGSEKGETIALRADMDALKIQEESTSLNVNYISQNTGVMHACGHDGHMAMLLGVARMLQGCKNQMKGNVKLIFQPAEEVPPGGAVDVIKMGGLIDADAILGIHLFANYSYGEICLKEGPIMASNCMFNIIFVGKSGHHSNPDSTIDPIKIASEFISTIQSKITKNLPPSAPYVFGFGTINGGEQFNQTPHQVKITGSYRMLDPKNMPIIEQTIRKCLDDIMQKNRKHSSNLPDYKLEITNGYPVLINHKKFTQRSSEILKRIFSEVNENIDPVFASEDFARYLEVKPGTFIFLGTGNSKSEAFYNNHSDKFDFDENVLIKGVEILFAIAIDFLHSPGKYL